jgi:hypothetical protein
LIDHDLSMHILYRCTQDVRTDVWSNKHEKGNNSQKSNIREISTICACSDHGQSRYQIWIKCDKRQMTSCIHKMCQRTYGQTNMEREITGWLIFASVIALFLFVWPYVHPHIWSMQLVICLLSHFIHIWYLGWPWSEHAHIIPISRMVDFCESYSPFHVCLTICPFAHLVYAIRTWKGL